MVERSLRKIAKELRQAAEEPTIDREIVQLAARRLIAQAEMLEEGLDAPAQVSA